MDKNNNNQSDYLMPPNKTIENSEKSEIKIPIEKTTEVMTADMEFPKKTIYEFKKIENGSLVVYFFHSERCIACQETYPIIESLQNKYPNVIFIKYSIRTGSGSSAYKQFADSNNLSNDMRLVPQIYVNGSIITDRFNIEKKLEKILSDYK